MPPVFGKEDGEFRVKPRGPSSLPMNGPFFTERRNRGDPDMIVKTLPVEQAVGKKISTTLPSSTPRRDSRAPVSGEAMLSPKTTFPSQADG